MSPVGAHGGNCAIESAAALANSLQQRLHNCRPFGLGDDSIREVLDEYQQRRQPRARQFHDKVHLMTRIGSWDSWWKWLMARFALPWFDDAESLRGLIGRAEKVNFIAEPSRAKGFENAAASCQSSWHSWCVEQSKCLYEACGGYGLFETAIVTAGMWGRLLSFSDIGRSRFKKIT